MATLLPETILQIFKSVVKIPKSSDGIQWRSDCPFHVEITPGDGPFHFNVKQGGAYQCKSCGVEGNIHHFAKHHDIDLSKYGFTLGNLTEEVAKYHNNMSTGSNAILSCWRKDVVDELKVGWNEGMSRYVFPIFNTRGHIVNVKQHHGKQKVGAKATLYPLNLVSQYDDTYVVICEGEKDAITLLSNGIQVITSTGGARTVPKNISSLRPFKRIYLCLDNDNSGQAGTDKWIVRLHQLDPTLHVRVCDLSTQIDGDVTDYFLTKGKNRDRFVNEILEKSRYAHRPFTDIPVFIKEVLTSELYLNLTFRDKVIFSTLVVRACRYYVTTGKIRGMRYELAPGQYIRSRAGLAKDCGKGMTEPMVRRGMVKLKKVGLIQFEDLKGKRGFRFTIVGWADEYGQTKPQCESDKTVKERFPYYTTNKMQQPTENGQSDS